MDISAGQVSNLLTKRHDRFHVEKEALLLEALQAMEHLQTDDTEARHQGQDGYCTFIGKERFSFFKSTCPKSRVNFLETLSGQPRYVFNTGALQYMTTDQGLGPKHLHLVTQMAPHFPDQAALHGELTKRNTSKHAVKIMTEAALVGGLMAQGMPPEKVVILSDDAGQFNILHHALC